MKKILIFSILAVCFASIGHAQIWTGKEGIFRDSIRVGGQWISGVTTDSSLSNDTNSKIPNSKAVREYVSKSNKRVVIFADCTSAPISYNVPLAALKSDWEYVFVKTDASTNLLNINADYIDSDTSKSMWGQYTARTLYSNGSKWCFKM